MLFPLIKINYQYFNFQLSTDPSSNFRSEGNLIPTCVYLIGSDAKTRVVFCFHELGAKPENKTIQYFTLMKA